MKLSDYLKDKIYLILLQAVCMGLLAFFLYLTNYPVFNILLILLIWFLVLAGWFFAAFIGRRNYFARVDHILENLDKRYLLGEMLPESWRLEDRLYRQMIHKSNKSVIEQIHAVEQERKDYEEYIESWVHEIKTPITSISLLCENQKKSPRFCEVALENQKIENYVDMALYQARSSEVYKDYMIQETSLESVTYEVLSKNRQYLIANQMQVQVDCPHKVYTDAKWIVFIVNQIILNSVKYKTQEPKLHIFSQKSDKGVLYTIEDNGIGIKAEEIDRIFEKGFTGSNGRSRERATGMGLYLVKKLCGKLGICVYAESHFGKGTRIILDFPISSYLSKL